MRLPVFPVYACVLLGLLLLSGCRTEEEERRPEAVNNAEPVGITLPSPSEDGDLSVEKALYSRISRRSFTAEPLTLAAVGQLLWAAQGINTDGVTGASRTAPSAGATNPMDLYLAAGNVAGLAPGLYLYLREEHQLVPVTAGDIREELAAAALGQQSVTQAPVSIILAADYRRTTQRYGDRGIRFVHIEAGHITQNILLQAEALKLGAVVIGAFNDQEVQSLLEIASAPLIIVPIGHIQ